MSVTVTLHVFSGRPDPAWELSEAQAQELAERIARLDRQTLLKPPGIVGDVGYRGFSVESAREPNLEPCIYLHAGIVEVARFAASRVDDSAEIEEWLLSTAGTAVDDEVLEYVRSELAGNDGGMATLGSGGPATLAVPPYNPGKWNNDPAVQSRNNCYNYANDKITNSFAQPGRGSGQMYSRFDCADVGAAAQRDGLTPIANASGTPVRGHYTALVIWPGQDYHWYRLDNNAKWSHKPGQTPAKNTDHGGRPINDPRSCDRGRYTSWCGYHHCIPANTIIL